jgi:salicylate hydroxylase
LTEISKVETGEVVGHLEWQEDIIREAGADFLLMHVSTKTFSSILHP